MTRKDLVSTENLIGNAIIALNERPQAALTYARAAHMKLGEMLEPEVRIADFHCANCGNDWRGPIASQNGLTVCSWCQSTAVRETQIAPDILDTANAVLVAQAGLGKAKP